MSRPSGEKRPCPAARRAPGRAVLALGGALLVLFGAGAPARAQVRIEVSLDPALTPWPAANRGHSFHPGWGGAQPGAAAAFAAPPEEPPPPLIEIKPPLTAAAAPEGVAEAVLRLPAVEDDDAAPEFLVALQPRPAEPYGDEDETELGGPRARIQLRPPGPMRLFRLESEASFRERIRQEAPRRQGEPIVFPDEPDVGGGQRYFGRAWPPQRRPAEPHYVCYKPLLFEQRNLERGGWDLGLWQPLASAGKFYADLLVLPYHLLVGPHCFDCSAGWCLPGDPAPYLLYPPRWPITLDIYR